MANWGGLPSVVSKLPNDLRNFLQRVKETLDGAMAGNNRFVTVNDLVNGNVATIDQYGNVTNGNLSFDYSPPPTPINLVAVGAITTIMLQWDDPLYANLAHAEVWRASVDNQGLAVLIGTSSGVLYADPVDAGSTYYYWVRFISKANVPGAFNAISGTLGQTSSDPTDLLTILTSQITASQLASSLGSRINLIDVPATGLIAQVGAITAQVIPVVNEQVDALAFAINELSLQASSAQQKLLFSKAITDATITVDPVAGTITLNAVEALKNGSDITLNTVETTLNAHDASIVSNASAISSVDGRVTSAESTIAQHSSDILLRATKTELNDVAAAILAGFTPAYTWAFNGTTESWTANVATLTAFSYDMEVAETGAGAHITSPAISVVGATYALIYIKLDKKAGTGWTGKVQYQTAAHGYSDLHHKIFAQPTWDATYKVLALDMTTLTAGGNDWVDSTITGIRIFLGAGSGDTTDVDTIEIGKSQIDQILTADINARLGSAEVNIDANASAIALKASQTTVDGHEARLTTAEADIDANAAAITLKAASTTVTAIDARLGAAEVDIDANTASISSKASIVTVDALDTRVSTAESNIDANTGSISLVTSQSQEATSNVNAVGDSLLSALLGLDNTLGRDRASSYGVATAMLEISSAVDALGAEAAARLLLEAAYQSTAAALSNDYYTKAAADAAVASYTASMSAAAFKQRIYRQPAAPTGVTLFIGDAWIDTANNYRISYWDGAAWQLSQDTRIAANAAAITAEQTARADGDSANASSISTVQARLDTGDYAAVKTESSANASAITGLSVEYSLKLDVNGYVSGYGTVNDGTSSEFLIATNTFGIVAPTLNSATEPATKYHGLIWKNTSAGTVAGVPPGESRRWVVVGGVGSWQLVGFGALPFAVLTTATTINGTEFQPGVYIDGASIVEATIGNAQIANLAVDDTKIADVSVDKLTAGSVSVGEYIKSTNYVSGSAGWRIHGDGSAELNNIYARGNIRATSFSAITLQTGEHIKQGSTAYNTGNGFFLGDNGAGTPVFSLKSATNGLTWDGASLSINGSGTFSGSLNAATGTFSGALSAATGSFSGSLSGADITGATGTFSGLLAAGTVDITKLIGTTTNYTAAGTYTLTVPADKTSMRVTLLGGGGGGGGGGSRSMAGGGGGAGQITVATFSNLVPGATYTLVVGNGGIGGAGVDYPYVNGTQATPGGATHISGLVSASGGARGENPFGNGLGGAIGGTNATTATTSWGSDPIKYLNTYTAGNGGSTMYGTGGTGKTTSLQDGGVGTGAHGSGFGSGGAGGSYVWYSGSTGGNGAPGGAIIEFFNPNGVVIRNEYNALLSALTRQGISVI